MRRLVIVILVIGVIGFVVTRNMNKTAQMPSPEVPEQHAAITNMALQSEAKAKQAAAIASTDTVAQYENSQNQQ